ncbi:MAG: TIGR02300 family protein [Rhodospirillales bacterium]|nr:TIGR02300 family protein [Rhodospirillales bacterium]
MTKSEWGLKRICLSCSARFYDMGRSPIICPKCGATFDPEAVTKTKRAKPVPPPERVVPPPPAPVEDAEVADDVAEVAAADDEEEETVIEDTSELGEDNDDVAEVIENVDEEEDR